MFSRMLGRTLQLGGRHRVTSMVSTSSSLLSRVHARQFTQVGDIVRLPAMSPTMEDGEITRWIKKEGDEFAVGEVLFEVETDKATLEVEAQEDGVLAKILVAPGQRVAVGHPIAVTVEEGVDPTTASIPDDAATPAAPAATPAATPAAATPASSASAQPAHKSGSGVDWSQRLLPSVGYLAGLHGVSTQGITGSGPNGIVTKGDLLAAIANGSAQKASASEHATHRPGSSSVASTDGASSSSSNNNDSATAPSAYSSRRRRRDGPTYEDIPHSNMRRVIASRLSEAKFSIPHQYMRTDAPVDRLLAVRKEFNADPANEGQKISVNDLVIKAIALSLRAVPGVLSDPYAPIDVSVAVATETGLITPIVKAADFKPVEAIAADVRDLATRAKANKLKPEEFQGGTVTVSNLGMFGTESFTAIINPPQAIIFAIGTTTQQVGADGELYSAMSINASYDERQVDQLAMSKVLAQLSKRLSRPEGLL
eukprot:TRINITY_DN11209_c0_g1_i1.p1 TRINITY_DN11209_c0_g1~~TRINITY_DN11209_c0_g1_i1.p1  ORF type:complete len:482 (-),score=132.86 TRINITY_DN11209_c0_g1_i1:793-2238(-)